MCPTSCPRSGAGRCSTACWHVRTFFLSIPEAEKISRNEQDVDWVRQQVPIRRRGSTGIPAVIGVKHATRILRDGEMLEVDGGTGEVRLTPLNARRQLSSCNRDLLAGGEILERERIGLDL